MRTLAPACGGLEVSPGQPTAAEREASITSSMDDDDKLSTVRKAGHSSDWSACAAELCAACV